MCRMILGCALRGFRFTSNDVPILLLAVTCQKVHVMHGARKESGVFSFSFWPHSFWRALRRGVIAENDVHLALVRTWDREKPRPADAR